MNFTMDLNLQFFDTDAVRNRMDREQRRILSRSGFVVARRAKQSIRKRKRSAPKGMPPSSHLGTLKRFLFYAWDTSTESVFVGPVKLGASNAGARLEHAEDGYQGNPFMRPAAEAAAENGELLAPWKDAL